MDYAEWDAEDLLTALETAGRHLSPELLKACLAKREEITPTLLEWLRDGSDEKWAEEDPRGYREIHAGLMLIEFREAAALPVFDDILRDEDRQEALGEWFTTQLPLYGGAAVPWCVRLAQDEEAIHWGRFDALSILADVGALFPEERPRVIEGVLPLLPALRPDGTPDLAGGPEEVDHDQVILFTSAVNALMDARDPEVRPQALALFDAGLIDETLFGDREVYRGITEGTRERYRDADPQELVAYYERLAARDEGYPDLDEFPDEELAELEAQLDELKARTGMSDEQIAQLMRDIAEGKVPIPEGLDFDDEDETPWESRYAPPPMPYHAEKQPGRNDPCPCGSGKKYKKCHGAA